MESDNLNLLITALLALLLDFFNFLLILFQFIKLFYILHKYILIFPHKKKTLQSNHARKKSHELLDNIKKGAVFLGNSLCILLRKLYPLSHLQNYVQIYILEQLYSWQVYNLPKKFMMTNWWMLDPSLMRYTTLLSLPKEKKKIIATTSFQSHSATKKNRRLLSVPLTK